MTLKSNIMKKHKPNYELRMYGLVNYQLGGTIHAGIQFGHAVVEYGLNHNTVEYKDWAKNWKTFIILNGGTTNLSATHPGTLNKNLIELKSMGVKVATFHEPDLGDQLTAVVFILDERIFNKKLYPDYNVWLVDNSYVDNNSIYKKWLHTVIGGEKNLKIRNFINRFKLI